MRRLLLKLLGALSLALCVAACVLSVRSYRSDDVIEWALPFDPAVDYWRRRVTVEIRLGRMFIGYTVTRVAADDGDSGIFWNQSTAYIIPSDQSRFAVVMADPDSNVRVGGVLCPAWSVAATALLICGSSLRLAQRPARLGSGRCPRCGYDLRATPERCPECGAAPTGVKT